MKFLPIALASLLGSSLCRADVVINEVHYDPTPANDPVQFVELYNSGAAPVDLSGWSFSNGVSFTFPAGATLGADGYAVVVEHIDKFTARFSNIFTGNVKPLGQFTGQLSNGGERLVLRDAKSAVVDEVDYQDRFPWPSGAGGLGSSMELIHPKLDNSLGGHWRAGALNKPTPGERNSVYSETAPPVVRQVNHAPKAPKPGEAVTVTARVTDPEGVGPVTLKYQLVKPGEYIHLKDPAYETQWTDILMRDDGANGDAKAADDIYTAVLPGDLQKHRHLLRYRIVANDKTGASVRVPYTDDGQPNFAYFCYGQMPAWTGAVKQGDPEVTYSPESLQTVPVYHLITTRQHHVDAQYIPDSTLRSGYTGALYQWDGTLVYGDEVYDHIKFRARGGVWRYAMGKNMWKFMFNRGREFEARDQQGEKYPKAWRRLNFSAIIQQGDFQHRGEQGLFESVGFQMFNMAGIEAPRTHYAHYRIIENAEEAGAGTQYGTDFQGLYLVVEQVDNRFLESHGLPSGNIFKMEGGTGVRGLGGELKNLAPYPAVSDSTDLEAFKKTYEKSSPKPTQEWWEQNLDLDRYYAYRSIVESIHHYDIGDGKNYYYYQNPLTKKWITLPWDLDLTWADNMYGSGAEPFKSRVINAGPFKIAYENRLRELRDLLCNEEQVGMLIDEKAAIVHTPGKPSLVDADRAMWDYNPILKSKYVNSSKAGHGLYYRKAATKDFVGMKKVMRDYIIKRMNVPKLAETDIPATPTVAHVSPTYGIDDLRFECGEFNAGASNAAAQQFAALEWRIAEVTDPKDPNFNPAYPNSYEINATWESGEITTPQRSITIPSSEVKPDLTYRVRVRMKNTLGYWSHWSAPSQFVAKAPDLQGFRDGLVISEIMYAPAPAIAEEIAKGFATADFEFIELTNLGTTPLDLTHVRFTKGIDYDFANGAIKILAAGQRALLVRNKAAFESRHGAGLVILAEFKSNDGNKLENNGEPLKLSYGAGISLREVDYSSEAPWPVLPTGHSLVLDQPETRPDHALPASWKASAKPGGSPGLGEAPPASSTFAKWAAESFSAAQLADVTISGPLANPDRDAWVNVFEYLFFGSPLVADEPGPRFAQAANSQLTLQVRRRASAGDVAWKLESSADLRSWAPAGADQAKLISTIGGADGSQTSVYEIPRSKALHFRVSAMLGQ